MQYISLFADLNEGFRYADRLVFDLERETFLAKKNKQNIDELVPGLFFSQNCFKM
jgi:hypothetical protein